MRTVHRLLMLGVVVGAVTFGVATLLPGTGHAAAFTVTKTADTNDGSCTASDCSLREAVIAANGSPGADVITVPSGTYVLTLTGSGEENAATGDLDITDDVTINGLSTRQTIIDGNLSDRVFEVKAGVSATITDLWIRNGDAPNGGGVDNEGSLTLTDVLVRENSAGSGTTANGGGIQNSGTLTVNGGQISINTTTGSGGGLHNTGSATLIATAVDSNIADINGGGINNVSGGTLTIQGGTVSFNTAASAATGGGGILADSGMITIDDATISGNTAVKNGGGLNIGQNAIVEITTTTISLNSADDGGGIDAGGAVTIRRSAVHDNQSSDDGAGAFVTVSLTVIDSTFSGNVSSDDGGGIVALSGSEVTLTHATLSDNSSTGGGGGIRAFSGSMVQLQSTIVALNPTGGDCSGDVTSLGTNLDSDGTCSLTAASDQPSVAAPGLGTLQDNGGATLTHALLASSPAIDAASAAAATATDQRGVPRNAATADIGAFERSLIDIFGTIVLVPADPALHFDFEMSVDVGNKGPDTAIDVAVAVALPPGLEFVDAPAGCDVQDGAVVCELGNLASGETQQRRITVRPTVEGAIILIATVVAIGEEQNPDNNSAEATAQVGPAAAVGVALSVGWNLIGWQGPATAVADAIEGIVGDVEALFVFNAATQQFLTYSPAAPTFLNTLTTLDIGQAIFLRISNPQGAVWEQPLAEAEVASVIALFSGANLVTWSGASDGLVAALDSLGDALVSAAWWDPKDEVFLTYSPLAPAFLNTLTTLAAGQGIWVIVSRDVEWDLGAPQ